LHNDKYNAFGYRGINLKELNDISKTSIKGSYFLFLGNTSSLIIMAVTVIVAAKFLGPENYGLYSVTLIVPTFLVSVCDLGTSPALTRFSAQFHVDGINKVDNLIKFGLFPDNVHTYRARLSSTL
jgi:O-antigen/teichoic acid export membrane protein